MKLIASDCLDPRPRPGSIPKLTTEDKAHLAAIVRRGHDTRRMELADLRREAGLSHVSDTTALNEQSIKAYREGFKFILTQEYMAIRKVSGILVG